ncbi:MAG: glycosyltransferase family 4 protein [Verrucomicrobiota bacterium]|nr:glycosyltransferase family 4 protein [Verrucomicrobiota bacterium]
MGCFKRDGRFARALARVTPGFAWRWGLKSAYGWEQFSFWWRLWPRLRRGGFDILHAQDPMLAYWCRKFRRLGLVRTREILAHGTEEPAEFIGRLEFVQHLAPWHLEQARRPEGSGFRVRGSDRKGRDVEGGRDVRGFISHVPTSTSHTLPSTPTLWFSIPNFVDVERFKPDPEARLAVRSELGISDDAFVAIAVGALKRNHKRVDWLIGEFAAFAAAERESEQSSIVSGRVSGVRCQVSGGEEVGGGRRRRMESGRRREESEQQIVENAKKAVASSTFHLPPSTPTLLLVGASTPETAGLADEAREKAGERIVLLWDRPREAMPGLLAAADVFVHAALFEMMPIAFLEAAACGLPLISRGHPVMRWIMRSEAGNWKLEMGNGEENPRALERLPGGWVVDMTRPGALAGALEQLRKEPALLKEAGRMARQRAAQVFSKEAVVGRYISMYEAVMGEKIGA